MSDQKVLKDGIPYRIEKSEKSAPFWQGLNEGKLMTTKCKRCSTLHFPPSPILCTSCFNTEVEWISLPLEGTITTYTAVSIPPDGFSQSYTLVSVRVDQLDKVILGRFIGENPQIGDRVKIEFEDIDGQSLLVFR